MIILAKNTFKNNRYHNSKNPPVVAGALYERVTGSQISLYAEPFPLIMHPNLSILVLKIYTTA
jgi:hypothetical protein